MIRCETLGPTPKKVSRERCTIVSLGGWRVRETDFYERALCKINVGNEHLAPVNKDSLYPIESLPCWKLQRVAYAVDGAGQSRSIELARLSMHAGGCEMEQAEKERAEWNTTFQKRPPLTFRVSSCS